MPKRQAVQAMQAKPPRYGFWQVLGGAALVSIPGERWEDGFSFQPEQCGQSGRSAIDCGTLDDPFETGDRPSTVDADPFVVWAGDECSTFGYQARDWVGRATRQLTATRSYQIAREVWYGDTASGGGNLPLTDSAGITVSSSPMSARKGLACLERAIGDCAQGTVGLIHMNPQVLTELAGLGNTIHLDGTTWVTPNGHVIIPDAGYSGSPPDGIAPDPDSQWMYGTTMMALRASDVVVNPPSAEAAMAQMDRSLNDAFVYASQLVAVSWDQCCLFAAEVAVPQCEVGLGS